RRSADSGWNGSAASVAGYGESSTGTSYRVLWRNRRPLSLLRQRRAKEHGCLLPERSEGGMTLKRQLGLDILRDKYSYATDAVMGFTSSQKIPDRWVATTCGYCSVGCGMLVGVRNGKAVSVRGNSNHPVNRGMLCPKGLSEHHIIEADTRAKY